MTTAKKKVKLKDLNQKGFSVKKSDRPSVNSAMTAVNTSRAVESIQDMSKRQIEILEVMAEATKGLVAAVRMPTVPQEQPKIEVIVPTPERIKRRVRFKVIRTEDGFIDYVDMIEME